MKIIKSIIIVICIILAGVVAIIVINGKQANKPIENNINHSTESKIQDTKVNYEKVKSATSFFTVQSCINKYLSYINANDNESVFKILDEEYLLKNKITKQNVFENIKRYDNGAITFQADKMYMEQIDDDNIKYYVHGIVKNSFIEELSDKIIIDDNFQIIVKLNFENMVYSVMPLENGGMFNERSN